MRSAWHARRCGCGTIKPLTNWDTRRGRQGKRCAAQWSGFRRTDIVKTWLLVAAERREFAGILRRAGNAKPLAWPSAKFAKQVEWNKDRWWMIANGPGAALVREALSRKVVTDGNVELTGIISTGLCGHSNRRAQRSRKCEQFRLHARCGRAVDEDNNIPHRHTNFCDVR